MSETTPLVVRNTVKEKLARDEVVTSIIVRLVRTVEIVQVVKTAGFDTLYVDLEHNSFSLDTTGQICIAAQAAGIVPMVRVPANKPEYIGRVLDGGALGVIVPHITSAADAEEAVRHAKFTPLGERSAGGPLVQYGYRPIPVVEANAAMNDATMVVAMIETISALDEIDAIAAVEGIDMLLIGTNDLCAELGVPGQYGDPRIDDAYMRTLAAAKQHGKHVGIGGLTARPDLVSRYVSHGARFVSTGSDLNFLIEGAAARAAQVAALGTGK